MKEEQTPFRHIDVMNVFTAFKIWRVIQIEFRAKFPFALKLSSLD